MSKNSAGTKTGVTEQATGVATVSSPEVGANVQMPLGSSPPAASSYRKRNEREQKKLKTFKEWVNV